MPTPSKSVHFHDAESAIEGYEKAGTPAFGLFCGRQLISKYQGGNMDEGKAALSWWLEHFDEMKSAAIYTICLYEEVPVKGIKDNTPYDGSFNVRFVDVPIGGLPREVYMQYGGGNANAMLKELGELRQQVKELQDAGAEEEEENPPKRTMGDVMITALESQIPKLANHLSDYIFGLTAKTPAIMNGVTTTATPTVEKDRMYKACDQLAESVPDIAEVLEKLVLISRSKPDEFKLYIKALRLMDV
jgi:hypothetical protein